MIVPGHGPAHTSATALRLIDEDVAYLDALERGEEKPRAAGGARHARPAADPRANLDQVGGARAG